MPQYAGYMPAAQAGFYPNAYQSYPAYGGYSAGTMDPQYMGYYGMTAALPTATTVPTSQAGSTSNSQVKISLLMYCISLNTSTRRIRYT
jgi:hypothetical protein